MNSTPRTSPARRVRDTAFDLRWILSVLFGTYGVILTVDGALDTTPADLAKTGGLWANLWCGIALLVFAGATALWAWRRPLVTPRDLDDPAEEPGKASVNA